MTPSTQLLQHILSQADPVALQGFVAALQKAPEMVNTALWLFQWLLRNPRTFQRVLKQQKRQAMRQRGLVAAK